MEKDAVNQRIIKVINYLLEEKIVRRKSELAEKLGCSPQTITEILGERQGVKVDLLQKFFDIFNISYDYIFKGEGPILNKGLSYGYGSTEIRNMVAEENSPEFAKPKVPKKGLLSILNLKKNEPVPIPMVDISVAAGSGFFNPVHSEDIGYIHMPANMLKSGNEYLCVRIKGTSMIPTLQDGGFLIVRMLDRSEWGSIRDSHIYIVADREGRSFVKRLKNRLKEHGIIVLNSDNPDKMAFPSFNLTEEEINTIWYAEWYFTPKMPNIHDTYYNKVGELEENYNELREELDLFKSEFFSLNARNAKSQ